MTTPWNILDAELIDTLENERVRFSKPFNIRTAETAHRPDLKLSCAYCGRRNCREHKDLPKLDPYFNG